MLCHGTSFLTSAHMYHQWQQLKLGIEKLTFLQAKGLALRHSSESMFNFLGLGLSLVNALVILAAVCQTPTNITPFVAK